MGKQIKLSKDATTGKLVEGKHVIELTFAHPTDPKFNQTVYLSEKPEWDGAWYTKDIGKAKRFIRVRNAVRTIDSYGSNWATFQPRTVPV